MSLLRSFILASGKPVRQIRWPQHNAMIGDTFFLVNSRTELSQLRRELLSGSRARRAAPPSRRPLIRRSGMENSSSASRRAVDSLRAPYPVLAPLRRPRGSIYPPGQSRRYTIEDRAGVSRRAYRLVMRIGGASFGVQGVDWRDPPILSSPHSEVRVRGRRLSVYWDGRKPRLVAYSRDGWTFWVSNTLDRRLSSGQMLATAASLADVTRP